MELRDHALLLAGFVLGDSRRLPPRISQAIDAIMASSPTAISGEERLSMDIVHVPIRFPDEDITKELTDIEVSNVPPLAPQCPQHPGGECFGTDCREPESPWRGNPLPSDQFELPNPENMNCDPEFAKRVAQKVLTETPPDKQLPPSKGLSEKDIPAIQELVDADTPTHLIAKKYGCYTPTITKFLLKHAITKRTGGEDEFESEGQEEDTRSVPATITTITKLAADPHGGLVLADWRYIKFTSKTTPIVTLAGDYDVTVEQMTQFIKDNVNRELEEDKAWGGNASGEA